VTSWYRPLNVLGIVKPVSLPVVGRELRVASRRRSTYRTRTWAAVFAILVFSWALMGLAANHVPAAAQGRPLFLTLAVLAFIYCLFIGARVTADCLSEEKREGTLGLLFLTDLKGYDVVFGKLAATALHAFYGLLAVFPLLVLPLQMGGVTGSQIGRTVLVLLNTFFFSLSLGLFISARSTDERKAGFATFGALVLFAIFPGILTVFLASMLPALFDGPQAVLPISALSIGYPFVLVYGEIQRGVPPMIFRLAMIGFWFSLVFYHVLGWLCLWRAGVLLPRVWQADAKRGWMTRLQEKIDQWSYGRAEKRRHHRARLLDINPFLWLASRDRWKPRYVWFLLVTTAGLWCWSYSSYREMMFDRDTLFPAIMILNTFLKIWIASEACARLVADRRAGTMELLLSTPLSTGAIIRGQWLALGRQFLIPVLAVLLVEFYALRHSFQFLPVMACLTMLVVDAIALGWVSLWVGLSAKNTSRALVTTVALVLVLPWVLFGFVQYGLSLDTPAYNEKYIFDLSRAGFHAQVCAWFVLGLLADLLFGFGWAMPRLMRDFRVVASQSHASEQRSWIRRLVSPRAAKTPRQLSTVLDA
jgi:ABC-type Na+ efflux pump permease subunit